MSDATAAAFVAFPTSAELYSRAYDFQLGNPSSQYNKLKLHCVEIAAAGGTSWLAGRDVDDVVAHLLSRKGYQVVHFHKNYVRCTCQLENCPERVDANISWSKVLQ